MHKTSKSWIKHVSFLVLLLAIAVICGWQTSTVVIAGAERIDTRIWSIKFAQGLTSSEEEAIVAKMGGVIHKRIEPLDIAQIHVPIIEDGSITASSIQKFAEEPNIRFVETVANEIEGSYMPNDPAMTDAEKAQALTSVQVDLAWDYTTGDEEIIIAFLDSGVDATHSKFRGRLVGGYDFVNDDEDPDDDHGHGTHIAGILAANIDNDIGVIGVCPKCRMMPIKVLDDTNTGTWFQIAAGIVYAVDHGTRVINLSLGSTQYSSTMEEAIKYAREHDVVVVAAAGNYGSDKTFYPAAYEYVFAVAAVDQNNEAWSLNNFGDYVDIVAPGQRVYSTARTDKGEDAYGFMSGTSVAAPIVAGLAGLLLSQDSTQTATEVLGRIVETADDMGKDGWDTIFGHGCINAYAAVSSEDTYMQAIAQRVDSPMLNVYLPIIRR